MAMEPEDGRISIIDNNEDDAPSVTALTRDGINYLKETRMEMSHVTWPTRSQAIAFTGVVIVISIVTAAYLGFFDYIFSLILQKFVL